MSDGLTIREKLLEKANGLPLCPGVYIMRGSDGKVIYVGKSRKLRNRVSQYFQNGEKNRKTERMVASVRSFDYYLCDNEMEALSLENTLIKQYTPKYNIRLKDAKSYPYIKIPAGDYPKLTFTRHRAGDRAKYFGPYSGSGTAYALIDLVNKAFKLPTCNRSFPRDIGKERPCIYYQMGQCMGVCTGRISADEYREAVKNAGEVLDGKNGEVKRRLEAEMTAYAEEEKYESAAKCRDTLRALQAIKEKQKVVASPDTEQDVIALYSDDLCTCVSVFIIRGGILHDTQELICGSDGIPEPEDMTAFLTDFYRLRSNIPPEILIGFEMPEEECTLLGESLSALAGRKIAVKTPEKGTKHTLCELVAKNAAEKARQYEAETGQKESILVELSNKLGLEVLPSRIEAYDISNFGKEHLTAGMIVSIDGVFRKADYRSFKIRTVTGTDDYASMREALDRRLSHLSDENGSFSQMPDLILLDGGKGHVSVVRELLREKNIAIPVFGMVKDDYHKTRALCTDTEEISIAKDRGLFTLIYKIQEEVHRYTVRCMEQAKMRTLTSSTLTDIAGIGEKKAKKILLAFDSFDSIKNASVEQLSEVDGITQKDAEAVYRHYHKEKSEG